MRMERLGNVEQSSPEDIDRFLNLAQGSDEGGYNLLNRFVLYSPSANPDNASENRQFVLQASRESGFGKLYAAAYPEADELQIQALAMCDAVAIRCVQGMGQYYDYDPLRITGWQKQEFNEAALGISCTGDEWPQGFPRWESVVASPILKRRAEQGMPRTLQLFVAANCIADLSSRSDWRSVSADRLYHLQRFGICRTKKP